MLNQYNLQRAIEYLRCSLALLCFMSDPPMFYLCICSQAGLCFICVLLSPHVLDWCAVFPLFYLGSLALLCFIYVCISALLLLICV